MSLRFSIKKALGIVAVFSVCLAVMGNLGGPGIALAVVTASALSGMLVLARRENLSGILWVGFGAVVGAIAGVMFLSPLILSWQYGYDHGFGETAKSDIVGAATGALCGAVIGSWLNRLEARISKSENHSP